MEHAAVLVRGPAPVPRDVRRDQAEHSAPLERSAPAAAQLCRKTLLSPAKLTRLSDHIMRATDVLCLSAVTIRGLVHEWLDAEGLDVRPSGSICSCTARA